MAHLNLQSIIDLAPQLAGIPFQTIWSSYDAEADVLYLNFKKPSHADDTELTDDDVLIRYEHGEVVGVTVLHASQLPHWIGHGACNHARSEQCDRVGVPVRCEHQQHKLHPGEDHFRKAVTCWYPFNWRYRRCSLPSVPTVQSWLLGEKRRTYGRGRAPSTLHARTIPRRHRARRGLGTAPPAAQERGWRCAHPDADGRSGSDARSDDHARKTGAGGVRAVRRARHAACECGRREMHLRETMLAGETFTSRTMAVDPALRSFAISW